MTVRSMVLEYVLQDGVIADVKWVNWNSRAGSVAVISPIALRGDYPSVPLELSETHLKAASAAVLFFDSSSSTIDYCLVCAEH